MALQFHNLNHINVNETPPTLITAILTQDRFQFSWFKTITSVQFVVGVWGDCYLCTLNWTLNAVWGFSRGIIIWVENLGPISKWFLIIYVHIFFLMSFIPQKDISRNQVFSIKIFIFGAFKNYVDHFLPYFDHLPTSG